MNNEPTHSTLDYLEAIGLVEATDTGHVGAFELMSLVGSRIVVADGMLTAEDAYIKGPRLRLPKPRSTDCG